MPLPLTLVIANKNYSSWSLRPWLAMAELGIPFTECQLKFHSAAWDDRIADLSPTRLVPVLWEGVAGDLNDGAATFDSLAILERLHELYPSAGIWPADAAARSWARALAADFHAGYRALRTRMPMNIRSRLSGKGMSEDVSAEVTRLTSHWHLTRERFPAGGPFLFGEFCGLDAFYAPVASRFLTYGVSVDGDGGAYCDALLRTVGMKAWTEAALQEVEFVPEDEPYQKPER